MIMKKWIYILIGCLSFSACQEDEKAVVPEVGFSDFQDPRDGTTYKCITAGGDIWLAENLRYHVAGGFYSGCLRYGESWAGWTQAQFDTWLKSVYKAGKMEKELYDECSALRGQGYVPRVLLEMIGYKFPETLLDEIMVYDKTAVNDFGYLYSYEALKQAVIPGWEIPSDADWKRLEQLLGMSGGELDRMEAWRGNGQAELLMEGEQGIGFNVKFGGGRVYHSDDRDGVYEGKACKAIFWASDTLDGGEEGYLGVVRTLLLNDSRIWKGTSKRSGTAYYVRCIRRKQ